MSIGLVRLGKMVRLVTPNAVDLSVWIVLLGCGYPISMSFWCSGTISLAVVNNPESSASVAENMTYFIFYNSKYRAIVAWNWVVFCEHDMGADADTCLS